VLKAGVADLSEAVISVNGGEVATLTLGESANGFELSLALPEGRQIIKIIGYDLCHRVAHTISLDVTVRLPEKPVQSAATTRPGSTPTAPTAENPVVYHEATAEHPDKAASDNPSDSPQAVIPASGAGWLDSLIDWLDVGPTFAGAANVVRAIAAITGLVILLNTAVASQLATALTPHIFRVQGKITELRRKRLLRQHLSQTRLLVQAAAGMVVIMLFVV
jgi:hypothetical protein